MGNPIVASMVRNSSLLWGLIGGVIGLVIGWLIRLVFSFRRRTTLTVKANG